MSKRPIAYIIYQPMRYEPESMRWIPSVDLSSAGEFGEIQFLLSIPEKPPLNPEAVLPLLRERLKRYSREDYIVMAGYTNLIGYAMMLAGQATGGFVNCLVWNPKIGRYSALPAQVYGVDEHHRPPPPPPEEDFGPRKHHNGRTRGEEGGEATVTRKNQGPKGHHRTFNYKQKQRA